tara:strand:- start:227 stop:340 length:114 start_codon:yes stop_codon:yes gene_type:complete
MEYQNINLVHDSGGPSNKLEKSKDSVIQMLEGVYYAN